MIHKDKRVAEAILKLNDAICEYERTTQIDHVVIIRGGSFVSRSLNGKPVTQHWVSDEDLINQASNADTDAV